MSPLSAPSFAFLEQYGSARVLSGIAETFDLFLQTILEACEADLHAVVDRDPACEKFSQCMLYFKGFQAIQCHRLNHWLWKNDRRVRLLSLPSDVLTRDT